MKYFYTDPLAAAWMAKYFGMRFYSTYPNDKERYEVVKVHLLNDEMQEQKNNKYYVHPNSLHILKPQIDDIIDNTANDQPPVVWFSYSSNFNGKIISRNGITFIWPEREEVYYEWPR